MDVLETSLRQGLSELSLILTDAQVANLLAYQALIQKWNKVYNLTAVRDPAEMLTHHLLDSLAVIQPLRRQWASLAATGQGSELTESSGPSAQLRLLDVGSGAGLPGVVIAICCSDVTVDCVDTVAKKSAFVQQVAVTLKLSNLRGLHARVENLRDKYDVISARAFASLADFTTWSMAALADHGVWMAMKAKHPADELAALPAAVRLFHVEQLTVPGLGAERCLLWLRRTLSQTSSVA
jgi:16S rRNA (guanine527-N7)-methyltransferase